MTTALAVKTATVTTGNLRTLLAAAIPFTDSMSSHPILECVRIEAAGGTICATATDRYTAGHVRQQATGTLAPAYLRHDDVTYLIGWLKAREEFTNGDTTELAELSHDENGRLKVAVGDHAARPRSQTFETWPNLGPLFDVTGTAPDGPVGLSMFVLDKLTTALTAVGRDKPARWTVGGPTSAVRVEVEDWFVAIVMPVHAGKGKSWADKGRVPYGLPAEASQ